MCEKLTTSFIDIHKYHLSYSISLIGTVNLSALFCFKVFIENEESNKCIK